MYNVQLNRSALCDALTAYRDSKPYPYVNSKTYDNVCEGLANTVQAGSTEFTIPLGWSFMCVLQSLRHSGQKQDYMKLLKILADVCKNDDRSQKAALRKCMTAVFDIQRGIQEGLTDAEQDKLDRRLKGIARDTEVELQHAMIFGTTKDKKAMVDNCLSTLRSLGNVNGPNAMLKIVLV